MVEDVELQKQPCGHHISLKISSVESTHTFCELCEMRSERNDAVEMEIHLRAKLDAIITAAMPFAETTDFRALSITCSQAHIRSLRAAIKN